MSDQKCIVDGVPFDKEGNPRKRFAKITYEGSWFICRSEESESMIGDVDDRDAYIVEDVFMSQQEYEALPEFVGW